MVGMWYQFMQRYCAAGENFGLSAGNHVLLNGSQITKFLYMISLISLGKASGNQTPYRSQNPHLHHQPAQFNRWDVQVTTCSHHLRYEELGMVWLVSRCLTPAVGWNTAVVHNALYRSYRTTHHHHIWSMGLASLLWCVIAALYASFGWWYASLARGV